MSAKQTWLVATLATAALVSAGCQQRADANSARGVEPTMERMQAKTGQVTDQVATAANDTAITAKVKLAILAEPALKALRINVETKDATVTLTGSVSSDMLRDRTKQIAMSIEGVKNVVDNLTVSTS